MIDAGAWEAFGGVSAILVLLGGVALALQRLGILRAAAPRSAPAAPPAAPAGAGAEDLAARLAALERDHARLAAAVAALPAAREFRSVAEGVVETRGDVRAIRASLDGIERAVAGLAGRIAAIDAHLRERGA